MNENENDTMWDVKRHGQTTKSIHANALGPSGNFGVFISKQKIIHKISTEGDKI